MELVSPVRCTKVSITFWPGISERVAALNKVSLAGLLMAYSPARRTTLSTTSTPMVGHSARAVNPNTDAMGMATSSARVPSKRIKGANAPAGSAR